MPTQPDLDALQKIENNLWRILLGVNGYVATAALRLIKLQKSNS